MTTNEIKAAAERLATARLMSQRSENDIHVVCNYALSHRFGVLKPLEWEDIPALSTSGSYHVYSDGAGEWVYRVPPPRETAGPGRCDSLEHGKRLCEQHYAASMAKAFTTIGETGT